MKCSIRKQTGQKGKGAPSFPKAKGALKAGDFILIDNQDDTFTVVGVDAQGQPVDISGVATLEVTSDNVSVLTVDPPNGMTSAMHAVGPVGSANINAVATWTDGSIGPFNFTLPVTVASGGAVGVIIQPGIPTSH